VCAAEKQADNFVFKPLAAYDFDIVLNRVTRTSSGPDSIPYWFIKACAFYLSPVLCKIVNFSLTTSCVPAAWKQATITPVPKKTPVCNPSDLRPISVTSLLSRVTEKVIVRKFLTPLLAAPTFHDQYAYKPTGSTTCALIDFTYRISIFLKIIRTFVACLLILQKRLIWLTMLF
jgi:hypothetical protein